MKHKHLKFTAIAFGILLLTAVIAIAQTIIGGVAGVALAAAGVGVVSRDTVTKQVTKAKSSDLLAAQIQEAVVMIKPSATPVDTITRKISVAPKTKSFEYKYYEVESRGYTDTVKSAVSAAAADRPAGYTFDVPVNNVHIWNVDDVVLAVDVSSGTYTDFAMHISAINTSTGVLTVIAINGGGANEADNPAIPQDTQLVWLGNSKHELDAQSDPYHIFPQPRTNYLQRFMAQVEESMFMLDHNKEVKWNIADHRVQALYSFRIGQELALLFGIKGYKLKGQNYYHYMDGIVHNISKTDTYTNGNMKTSDLYSWAEKSFTKNAGSDKKFIFGGGGFIRQLNALEPVQKQQGAQNTEVIYGITFNKIVTNFGMFYVMHHDLLNTVNWTNKAIVLDLPYILRPTWKPLKTTKLELIKSGQKNANAYVLDETFTVATQYSDTHMIIQPS